MQQFQFYSPNQVSQEYNKYQNQFKDQNNYETPTKYPSLTGTNLSSGKNFEQIMCQQKEQENKFIESQVQKYQKAQQF